MDAGIATAACGTVKSFTVPQGMTMTIAPRVASATNENEVTITRLLNAPRELVFKAWTDPKHVMQWWGPKGFHNTECKMDVKAGGRFELHMTGPDGVSYPCIGHYEEITAPERIVFIGEPEEGHPCGAGLPPRARITVSLIDFHGKTELTIHTRFESAVMQQAAVAAGYRTGWEGAFERLANYLNAQ